MSNKIDTKFAVSALDMAVRRCKPSRNLTFRSDRGSQYAALKYQEKLKSYGIKGSMSRSGNPYDNAVAESFNSRFYNTSGSALKKIFHTDSGEKGSADKAINNTGSTTENFTDLLRSKGLIPAPWVFVVKSLTIPRKY